MNLDHQIDFSLRHATWAVSRLLDSCQGLTDEQFNRDLSIGPGSLRVNLAHTIEAMFYFADCFNAADYVQRPRFAELSLSVDGLRQLLIQADRELSTAMLGKLRAGLPESFAWQTCERGRLGASAAIAQVIDHAAAHRAQCVNMLKRLGVSPLPDLDPMTYETSSQTLTH